MNSWETTPPRPSASRTACGPSARNDRARRRSARLASWRAAFTLGERMLVSSGPNGSLMPEVRSAASAVRLPRWWASASAADSAFFAMLTSAEKAGGSDTASSASMRRSTSTPAALRPWMNRL